MSDHNSACKNLGRNPDPNKLYGFKKDMFQGPFFMSSSFGRSYSMRCGMITV